VSKKNKGKNKRSNSFVLFGHLPLLRHLPWYATIHLCIVAYQGQSLKRTKEVLSLAHWDWQINKTKSIKLTQLFCFFTNLFPRLLSFNMSRRSTRKKAISPIMVDDSDDDLLAVASDSKYLIFFCGYCLQTFHWIFYWFYSNEVDDEEVADDDVYVVYFFSSIIFFLTFVSIVSRLLLPLHHLLWRWLVEKNDPWLFMNLTMRTMFLSQGKI
jgi:hypothetical protein